MVKDKYTVKIGNLKVSGSAEDIHKLANVYGIAACEYGHLIIDEIHSKDRDTLITELETEQRELEHIEKLLIDTIRDSEYYRDYSSEMSGLIDDVLEKIEHDERSLNSIAM